ncbi:BSD domain [Sesbania bispinosa]|nr:BSD domain [Sesbania bispinosa]
MPLTSVKIGEGDRNFVLRRTGYDDAIPFRSFSPPFFFEPESTVNIEEREREGHSTRKASCLRDWKADRIRKQVGQAAKRLEGQPGRLEGCPNKKAERGEIVNIPEAGSAVLLFPLQIDGSRLRHPPALLEISGNLEVTASSFSFSMSSGQVVKRAKYKTTVKDPGTPGVLKLTQEKLVFRPNDPTSNNKLEVEFKFIKSHKHTKEGSNKPPWLNLTHSQGSYIFELESFSDLHICRELVGIALSKHGEATKVISDEQLSSAEMALRIKLLQEDSKLQKLHKELVASGKLTESEFWATKKKLLDQDESRKSKQRIGFKNSLIFDTKPTSDGRINQVKFQLTPEIKYQACFCI